MSYKTVWKLCAEERGQLVSAVAYAEDSKVVYKIGEVTKPKIGLLFAFDTKENAYWGKYVVNYQSKIVKCKAKISKRHVPVFVSHYENRWAFWNYIIKKVRYPEPDRTMPKGTIFCTEVIPIEIDDWRVKK